MPNNKGLIIQTQPLDVYEQMATDEYFCEIMPTNYVLRFFNWKNEGITFGFSQRYNEVINKLNEIDQKLSITRRPTGGGIVFHKQDLTFSFIFYNPEEFNPHKIYEKLHTSINNYFLKAGFSFEISEAKASNYFPNNPVMDCFSRPVEKDLLANGKKILGGALRKFSDYLLYQASFQAENARKNKTFIQIIQKAFSSLFDIFFEEYNITKNDFEKISKIAYNKYKSNEWLKRI